MGQDDRAALYQDLKARGAKFEKPFVNYTFAELQQLEETMAGGGAPTFDPSGLAEAMSAMQHQAERAPRPTPTPVRGPDPDEMPGQRLNTKEEWEPIRTDEQGRVWFQEEVKKPAYPKPRGRRKLTYSDAGVETKTVKVGTFTETFEVSGDARNATPSEVKVTLPSYQVGIYKDPRFPFKIHTYNGVNGFDLFDVQEFYGGAELVPKEAKRMYVSNDLCYDIRTTVGAIEAEYRRIQLAASGQVEAAVR